MDMNLSMLSSNVDEKSHLGHMKAVQQSVLNGTWKLSTKLAITARKISPKIPLRADPISF